MTKASVTDQLERAGCVGGGFEKELSDKMQVGILLDMMNGKPGVLVEKRAVEKLGVFAP